MAASNPAQLITPLRAKKGGGGGKQEAIYPIENIINGK